jgi:hypothetical protein
MSFRISINCMSFGRYVKPGDVMGVWFKVLHWQRLQGAGKDLVEYGQQNHREEPCAQILMPIGMSWPKKC